MRRSKILRALQSPVWAITDEAREELRAMVDDDEEMPMKPEEDDKPDSVALIRLHGPMVARGNWITRAFGLRSYDDLAACVRAATEDASIKAIVMDFDTGGGSCAGLSEVGEAVAKAASVKPTVAVVSHAACSAGYWLASQCSKIVASDASLVGSIGTVILHADLSKALSREGVNLTFVTAGKNKTEGSPYKPLTPEGKAHLQGMVDSAYAQFVSAVARGRGVPEETVRSAEWGEGRVLMAENALAVGMIDEIGNLSSVVDGLLSGSMKVPLKSLSTHAEAPILPVSSSAQLDELVQVQSVVSISEAVEALANSENPLDNPDTRRAAAEENTMNEEIKAAIEGMKASLSAVVDPLTAKIGALETKLGEVQASADAATASAEAATKALADATAQAQAESLDVQLNALQEAGILTPADVDSERELLADAKPEKVKARIDYLSKKTPDFKALSTPFVVGKVGDREATINAADFTIHGAAPDNEGLDLVARATAMAGGNSGEHYPAYRKALDQLTGGALGEN